MRRLSVSIPLAFAVCAFTVVLVTSCVTGVSPEEAASAYYDLGNAYFDLKRYDDAIAAYSRAVDLDPSILQAGYNLSRVYIETGRESEAIVILESMLESDPENTVLLATIAWAEYKSGNLDASLAGYERVLTRVGNDRDALFNAAMVARRLNMADESIGYLNRYYRDSEDASVLPLLGRWEIEAGVLENGIARLELYTAAAQPDVDLLVLMGETYATLERFGDAEEAYGKALDRDSSRSEVRFKRAEILLEEIEDYATGMDELKKALEAGYADQESLRLLLENARSYYAADLAALLDGMGITASD